MEYFTDLDLRMFGLSFGWVIVFTFVLALM